MWLATVEAMARRGRTTRRVLAGVLLAVALVANVAWSPSPLGRQFLDNGWWAGPDPRHATVRAALRVVPDGAGVSASTT